MFTRRKFLIQGASSLALTLAAGRLAKAAAGEWAQQQGGSQDLQTGLVWLDYTLLSGDILSYPQAVTDALDFPFAPWTSAYNDWRVPTLDEMTTACAHGLAQHCPLAGTPGVYEIWWSSKTRAGGKQAAVVDLRTGASDWALVKNSYLYAIFVRQGT